LQDDLEWSELEENVYFSKVYPNISNKVWFFLKCVLRTKIFFCTILGYIRLVMYMPNFKSQWVFLAKDASKAFPF